MTHKTSLWMGLLPPVTEIGCPGANIYTEQTKGKFRDRLRERS